MANANRRRVERGHTITVTLVGTHGADVFILKPTGGGEHPTRIDLTPFFAAGMDEGEALERALEIVAIGVRCSA
jgi:hypothetical protein